MKLLTLLLVQYTASQCTSKTDCNHGDCVNGQCVCEDGWTGNTCNTALCVYGSYINEKCTCSISTRI